MTIDWTKPVRTKSGEKVEILTMSGRGTGCVIGFVGGAEIPYRWTIFGSFFGGHGEGHVFDVENVPEPVKTLEVWVNVFMTSDGLLYVHSSRESKRLAIDATKNAVHHVTGRHKITLRTEFDE